jgi:hypothetical protein
MASGGVSMKTAADYRAMAEECFGWASEARTAEVRASYLQLAQVWLDTASKLDGLPPIRIPPASDEASKSTPSGGEGSPQAR